MNTLAHRLSYLGTETAFAVADMAATRQAQGHKIYPFHLGDINIAPPQALIVGVQEAIRSGKNGYCPGAGVPLLREQLAQYFGKQYGISYAADNVAIQPGGKPVISKFIQAVMNSGEEVLYPVPGFPIYESQIRYYGGIPVPYHYRSSGKGFMLDTEEINRAVTKNTCAIIFNNYHNPTGAAASESELDAIAAAALKNNLWILNDEAYCSIRYDGIAARSVLTRCGIRERTINLFTFSKQFAMTGWRLGAAIGPAAPVAAIAKMNVNTESCTTHFIQHAMGQALAAGDIDCAPILTALSERRDALVQCLNAIEGIEVVAPAAGFYVYCDVAAVMERKKIKQINQLMRAALQATGVSFCTGEHFGCGPDSRYARFAFSGITSEAIKAGGAALKRYFESDGI